MTEKNESDFDFFPKGEWIWNPPWHDSGQSLIDLVEHIRSQDLNELEMRRYWLFACGAIMNALYYDLMIAKSVGEIDKDL